jgi:hypothetical protein
MGIQTNVFDDRMKAREMWICPVAGAFIAAFLADACCDDTKRFNP